MRAAKQRDTGGPYGDTDVRKIISLFQRNYEGDRQVRDEVVPGAEWVLAGEGTPTRKWDGTPVLVRNGQLFKRYDAKPGRTPPAGFEPSQEKDPITGHWPGWVPVGDGPEDALIREAWANAPREDGSYELVGPKVNRNADGHDTHVLIRHGGLTLPDTVMHPLPVPRDFAGLRAYFEDTPIEGIVWHHPDGRMVKIKARDFGLPWPRARS